MLTDELITVGAYGVKQKLEIMEVHVRPYYWAFNLSATFGAPYQMICRLLLLIVLATLSYQPRVTNLPFCAPVIVFLCQQKYSHSFTQEVSLEEVSTRRRKDQRRWLQGKLARKVFLWFLSWPKDWMDAERHHRAIQLVSSSEMPCECWGLLLSLWWQNSKLLAITSFPTCTEAAAS